MLISIQYYLHLIEQLYHLLIQYSFLLFPFILGFMKKSAAISSNSFKSEASYSCILAVLIFTRFLLSQSNFCSSGNIIWLLICFIYNWFCNISASNTIHSNFPKQFFKLYKSSIYFWNLSTARTVFPFLKKQQTNPPGIAGQNPC